MGVEEKLRIFDEMLFTNSALETLLILTYLLLGIYLAVRAFKSTHSARLWVAIVFTPGTILYYIGYTIYIVIMAFIGSDELFDDNHLFKKDDTDKDTK